jgi:hypothetical protein
LIAIPASRLVAGLMPVGIRNHFKTSQVMAARNGIHRNF